MLSCFRNSHSETKFCYLISLAVMDKKQQILELDNQIRVLQNEKRQLEPGADDPLTEQDIEYLFTGDDACFPADDHAEIRRLWNMYVAKKSLREWSILCHKKSCEKGWHDEDDKMSEREMIACYLMNLHSEVSEAWEAFRKNQHNEPCDKADKMTKAGIIPLTCLEEEFADIVIRTLEDAHALGINIESAVERKLAFNELRPHRHGGKLA